MSAASQPTLPTSQPANRPTGLEQTVNAPPPVDMNRVSIENTEPNTRVNAEIKHFLDAAFEDADRDESEPVAARKRFYRRLETQSQLMWRAHHHMKDCLHYLLTDKDGQELPPELVRTKDGRARRSGQKRCNCMGCLYCRLLHAMAARKKADKFLRGWHKRGSWCVMVAPTLAHPDPTEPYKQLSGQFKRALQMMRRGNVWDQFCAKWGPGEKRDGEFAQSEWMYSMEDMINASYGFHPHQHAMYEIVASYIAKHPELQTKEGRAAWLEAFQKAHYKLWESALKKCHRHASPTFGIIATLSTLSEREISAGVNYITKAAAELTGAPSKDGKNGSRDIYALLDDVEDESLPDEARILAAAKYVEYQEGIRRKTRYFFSESSAKETGAGESKVPELVEEPYKEVLMVLTPLQDQRLMRARAWPTFCTLEERCSVAVAQPWLERFCPTPQARGRPVFGEEGF